MPILTESCLDELFSNREYGASELEKALVDELLDQVRRPREVVDGEVAAVLPPALLDRIVDKLLERSGELGNLLSLVNRLWLAKERAAAADDGRGDGDGLLQVLLERRRTLAEGGAPSARPLADLLGSRDTVLTLSRSSTVVEALAELDRSIRTLRVVMGEGRPLREGVTAARELAARGVDVMVVTDGVMAGLPLTAPDLRSPASFHPERAAVVLGADALGEAGVVNKSGSVALAATARLAGLPVYVVADAAKLLPPGLTRPVSIETDPVDLGAPAAVGPVNLPFECIDWSLVDAVVVGDERLEPEEVVRRAAAIEASPALLARLAPKGTLCDDRNDRAERADLIEARDEPVDGGRGI